jgi:hypothetical protein
MDNRHRLAELVRVLVAVLEAVAFPVVANYFEAKIVAKKEPLELLEYSQC